MFPDKLTRALQAIPTPGLDQLMAQEKTGSKLRLSRDESQAAACQRNSHVVYILPVVTFRTIDLGGKKIPQLFVF